MDFRKLYDRIIMNAQEQFRSKKNGYFEEHHIIPKCLDGSNEPANLVLLTPREHFLAHIILWKIHRTRKLRDPVLFFKGDKIRNSRLYEQARIAHIDEMRHNNPSLHLSEETKESKKKKLSVYATNRPAVHNQRISEQAKGKQKRLGAVLEEKSRAQIGESLKKYFAEVGVSEETREKLRVKSTGRKHTDQAIAKSSQAAKNRVKYKCPHCDLHPVDAGNITIHLMKKHQYTKDRVSEWKSQ